MVGKVSDRSENGVHYVTRDFLIDGFTCVASEVMSCPELLVDVVLVYVWLSWVVPMLLATSLRLVNSAIAVSVATVSILF